MNRQQRRASARASGRRAQGAGRKAQRVALLGSSAALAVGGPLVHANPAGAAAYEVTTLNNGGAGSLRRAIENANSSPGADTITFRSGLTGTITLTSGQLHLYDSVTIVGPGADLLTVSGGDESRVFYLYNPSGVIDVSISGLTVADGYAGRGAGIINFDQRLALTDMVFSGNYVVSHGAAVWSDGYDSMLTIQDSTLTGNEAGMNGGAIYVEDTSDAGVIISGTTISGNTAGGDGGGIYLYDPDGDVTITATEISGNTAGSRGGGIYLYDLDYAGFTLDRSTIAGNTAVDGGGFLLHDEDNPITISSSTISGNTASTGDGGGIRVDNPSHHQSIVHSTISGNEAAGSGGGVSFGSEYYGSALITHTLLGDNVAPTDADLSASNGSVEASWSLAESSSVVLAGTGNVTGVDAELGALQDNGGPTRTQAPAATSAAVDAGDPAFAAPPATDQRGAARMQGRIDIGSVELVGQPVDDTASVAEDGPVTGNVLTNDPGADLTAEQITDPAHGTVVLSSDGSFTYTPDTDFHGTDTFTYRATDAGLGVTGTATVTITVTPVPDPPEADDDTASVTAGESVLVDVLDGDVDPDGDTLSVSAVTQGTRGSVVVEGGQVRYTPNGDQAGTDSFTYTVSDGALTDTATVVVTIAERPNRTPSPGDDTTSVTAGESVAVQVLENDSDLDGDTLSVSAVTQGTRGTAVIDGYSVVYTPTGDEAGTDTFTYTVSDGDLTATATVTVTIGERPNRLPTADDDTTSVTAGESVLVDVLDGDADPDGDTLSVSAVTQGTRGSVVVEGGQVRYTPNGDQAGTDTFTYTVSDGELSATATVTVTIAERPNRTPSPSDDTTAVTAGESVAVQVLDNDSDLDGDTLSVSAVTQGTRGSAVIDGDTVVYTPTGDEAGSDTFTYTVSDGELTATATVTVTIAERPNRPPTADDDTTSVTAGESVLVDVLDGDGDLDGDTLTITGVTQGTRGAVAIEGTSVRFTPSGDTAGTDTFTYTISDGELTATATVTVTIAELPNRAPSAGDDTTTVDAGSSVVVEVLANDSDLDGDTVTVVSVGAATRGSAVIDGDTVVYTPTGDEAGTDTFTYTVSDGELTATATVTVTIGEHPNRPPTADDDTASVTAGESVLVDVLDGDADLDGDVLSVSAVTQGTRGTVVVEGTSVRYVPSGDEAGTDTFTYTVSDGALSATATVTVTIAEHPNRAPSAGDDAGSVTAGESVLVDVLANDTDLDGDALVVVSAEGAIRGTVAVEGTSVRYTPSGVDAGTDSFTYTVSDGEATVTAIVTVTIDAPPNAAPTLVADAAVVTAGESVVVDVLANDTDLDGDALVVVSAEGATRGTVVVEDGRVRYTPAGDEAGTDAFTYTVSDGTTTISGTVAVEVQAAPAPTPEPPVPTPDPPVPTPDPPAADPSAADPSLPLARTGADLAPLALTGSGLAGIGAALAALGRRRRRR